MGKSSPAAPGRCKGARLGREERLSLAGRSRGQTPGIRPPCGERNEGPGTCPWPLGALIPQFPRVLSQNVRAPRRRTNTTELRALPWTPILLSLPECPAPLRVTNPPGGTQGRKSPGKAGSGRTVDGHSRLTRASPAPARRPRSTRPRVVAARLCSARAVCRGVAGGADPSLLSFLPLLVSRLPSRRAATRRPPEQAAA